MFCHKALESLKLELQNSFWKGQKRDFLPFRLASACGTNMGNAKSKQMQMVKGGGKARPCFTHFSSSRWNLGQSLLGASTSGLPQKLQHAWTVYFTGICLWKLRGGPGGGGSGRGGGVWGRGRLWARRSTPATLSDVIINLSGKRSWRFSEVIIRMWGEPHRYRTGDSKIVWFTWRVIAPL